jgi:hypothetical protein
MELGTSTLKIMEVCITTFVGVENHNSIITTHLDFFADDERLGDEERGATKHVAHHLLCR